MRVALTTLVLVATACGGPRSYTRYASIKGGRLSSSTLLLHREATYLWSTPDKRWGFDIETEGKGGIERVEHRYFELSLDTGRCREVRSSAFASAGGDPTAREQAARPVAAPPFEVVGKSSTNDFEGVVIRMAGHDWEYSHRIRTRWTFPAPPISQPAWAKAVPLPSDGWLSMEMALDNIAYDVGIIDHELVARRLWIHSRQVELRELVPVADPIVWFEGTLLVAGDGWVYDLRASKKLPIPRGKVEVIALRPLAHGVYLLRIQPTDGPPIFKSLEYQPSSYQTPYHLLDFIPPMGRVLDARGDTQVQLESDVAWIHDRAGWRAASLAACFGIPPMWSDEVEEVGRP